MSSMIDKKIQPIVDAIKELSGKEVDLRRCGVCEAYITYSFIGSSVFINTSCDCTSHSSAPREVSILEFAAKAISHPGILKEMGLDQSQFSDSFEMTLEGGEKLVTGDVIGLPDHALSQACKVAFWQCHVGQLVLSQKQLIEQGWMKRTNAD